MEVGTDKQYFDLAQTSDKAKMKSVRRMNKIRTLDQDKKDYRPTRGGKKLR